jgi:general nucleoside transport system ATP-binding protein
MVHQHFTLGRQSERAGKHPDRVRAADWRLDSRRAEARARILQTIAKTFGLPVNPDARVADLSVGERQRVEILKALYREGAHPDPGRADRRAGAARGGAAFPARFAV